MSYIKAGGNFVGFPSLIGTSSGGTVHVLTPANAFPGGAFPQHLSGQSLVTNYLYPGAVQSKSTRPTVLSYANAFPGIPFPNHLAGQSQPQSFTYPGAAQPQV